MNSARKGILILGLGVVGIVSLNAAQAASFDCAKAHTKVEKLICADPFISNLDGQLGKVYEGDLAKANPGQKKRLVTEELNWLKGMRDRCATQACLKQAYMLRLADLKAFDGSNSLKRKLLGPDAASHTRFIYVANRKSGTVSECRVDPVRGVAHMGAITAGSRPAVIRTDATEPYAYVLDRGQKGKGNTVIAAYRIDAQGHLGKIEQISVAHAADMAIDSKGRRLYVSDIAGAIHEYGITDQGTLKQTRTVKVEPGISVIGIVAGGHYLIGVKTPPPPNPYNHDSTFYEYRIAHDGQLTQIGSHQVGAMNTLAMDPAAAYFYLASKHVGPEKLYEFAVGHKGALKPIGTIRLTEYIESMAVSKNGRYLSAATSGMRNGHVAQYTIERDGRLKKIGSGPAHDVGAIAVGTDGHVYATIQNHASLSEYVRHPDGLLAVPGSLTTRHRLFGLTFAPSGHYAYLLRQLNLSKRPYTSFLIREYAVGPHGVLTKPVETLPTPAPGPIRTTTNGRYAYQLDVSPGNPNIREYRVGRKGHLILFGSVPAVTSSRSLMGMGIDPAAPYLYVSGDPMLEYAIGPRGHLQKIGSMPLGRLPSPNLFAIDPAGRYLYVGWNDRLVKYDIGSHGVLRYGASEITSKQGIDYFMIDPTGRFAYAQLNVKATANSKSYMVTYAIKSDGNLREIRRGAPSEYMFRTGINSRSSLFYMSAAAGRNRVAAYRIKHDGRPLLIAKGFPGIYSVNNMAMDPAGKHLYLSDDISILDLYPQNSQWEKTSVYTPATIHPNGMISVMGACATGEGHGPSSAATTPY